MQNFFQNIPKIFAMIFQVPPNFSQEFTQKLESFSYF